MIDLLFLVQKMLDYLKDKRDVGFFQSLAGLMQSCRYDDVAMMWKWLTIVVSSALYTTHCFKAAESVNQRHILLYRRQYPDQFSSITLSMLQSSPWWCLCSSVLDLNAFERQNKAEGLGMVTEEGSGMIIWTQTPDLWSCDITSMNSSCSFHLIYHVISVFI